MININFNLSFLSSNKSMNIDRMIWKSSWIFQWTEKERKEIKWYLNQLKEKGENSPSSPSTFFSSPRKRFELLLTNALIATVENLASTDLPFSLFFPSTKWSKQDTNWTRIFVHQWIFSMLNSTTLPK